MLEQDSTHQGETGARSRDVLDEARVAEHRLGELVQEHGAAMYRVAIAVVGDHGLAEDVVQEVMLKVWKSAELANIEVPGAWLRVVTRNAAIDLMRRRRFDELTDMSMDVASESAGTAQIIEGRQHLAAVWEALSILDDDSRTMVVLRETEELSYDEIAAIIGTTRNVVKTKLYRARHALRQELAGWEG